MDLDAHVLTAVGLSMVRALYHTLASLISVFWIDQSNKASITFAFLGSAAESERA